MDEIKKLLGALIKGGGIWTFDDVASIPRKQVQTVLKMIQEAEVATREEERQKGIDCQAKHVKFEPPIAEWKCPKCGAKAGDFHIYEVGDAEADPDCGLTHPSDILLCSTCRYETSGQAFSNYVKKKLSMVPCPTCKGSGHVKESSK